MQHTQLNRTEKKAALTLASVFGIRMLGLFLIMPVLAIYGQQYPDYTPLLVGLAIGAYGLTQALLQIPFGILSDRFGRKPIIVFGLAIFAVGSAVAALADTLAWVIVGRVLQGAGAIAGAILALAADSSRDDQRPKVMAAIGMGIGLAFVLALIIGPLLGSQVGMSGLFWFTTLLAVLGLLLVLFTVKVPVQRTPARDILPVPAELKRISRDGQLLRLNAGVLVLHLVLTAWFVTLPLQLVDAGLAAEHHSWLYLPTLVLSFAIMIPMMLAAVRRQRQVAVMRFSMVLLALSLVAIAIFPDSLGWAVFAVWLFFVGFNYLEASFPALLTQHAPAGSKGSASGLFATCQFFGAFLGGVLGGWLYQQWTTVAVMIFCVALLLCWVLLSIGLRQTSGALRVSLATPGMTSRQGEQLADELTAVAGVQEVIVVPEEAATYLKVDREAYDPAAVKALLQRYT